MFSCYTFLVNLEDECWNFSLEAFQSVLRLNLENTSNICEIEYGIKYV